MKTPGLTRNNNVKSFLTVILYYFFNFLYGVELDFTYELFIYKAPLYNLITKQLFFHLFNYNLLANTHYNVCKITEWKKYNLVLYL